MACSSVGLNVAENTSVERRRPIHRGIENAAGCCVCGGQVNLFERPDAGCFVNQYRGLAATLPGVRIRALADDRASFA